MLRLAAAALCLLLASTTHAAVRGRVFVDVDGDGHFGAGDRPAPGVKVFLSLDLGWDEAMSDGDGHFSLRDRGRGLVWARVPDGHRPGPVYATLPADRVELALRPHDVSGPPRFVHGSDVHVGNAGGEAVASALAQALAVRPEPDFFTMTGDLASFSEAPEYETLSGILGRTSIPFVPVAGNHDFHDRGVRYRHHFGPSFYAFDHRGVRFVVVDMSYDEATQIEFARSQLVDWPEDRPAVVLTHFTPSDRVAASWRQLGVDHVFSGHRHTNRVVRREGLTEYKVQTLAMGGDYTPAGFRVVTLDGGDVRARHHTIVDAPVLELAQPRPGECVAAGATQLLVGAELGQPELEVFARIDGGASISLTRAGGWMFAAPVQLRVGVHTIELEARVGDEVRERRQISVCAAGSSPRARPGDWPQLGGGPGHAGMAGLLAPPLATAWTRTLGGHNLFAAPVAAGGLALAAVSDLDDGTASGLVAFDLVSGELRWQVRVDAPVMTTPVVHGDAVSFLASDGVLRTVSLDGGKPRWQAELGRDLDGSLVHTTSGPVAIGGLVVGALQDHIFAFDAATGAPRWQARAGGSAFTTHHAALAAEGETIVAALGRAPVVVVAFDLAGKERWRLSLPPPRLLESSPVIADGKVYLFIVDGELRVLDAKSGKSLWQKDVYKREDYVDWTIGPLAAPAVDDGQIYLATPRSLRAFELEDHASRWRREAPSSRLRQLPLSAARLGWLNAPVIAGDMLWLGAGDGWLRAFDRHNGELRWRTDLGTPITSSVAVAGGYLLVAGYDGTLRALVHREHGLQGEREPARPPGCGGDVMLLLLAMIALAWRRRLHED